MYIYNKQIYNDIYSYFRKYCAFTSLRLWVFILFPYVEPTTIGID